MSLSENIDIDREILLLLDEEDFRKFFELNKYFSSKVFQSFFLKRRLQVLYDYSNYNETYTIKRYKQQYELLKNCPDDLILEATKISDLNLISHALKKGADINTYKFYHPPLTYAVRNGDFDIVKYLIEHGAKVNGHPGQYVCINFVTNAAENGHLDILKYLMEEMNAKCNNYALIKACEKGHLSIVQYLVENQKLDIHVGVEDPLRRAAELGHLEIVTYLVSRGANVNANRENHSSALVYACKNNHFSVMKYLLEQGADINSNNDLSLLWSIDYNNNIDAVKYLVEHGSNVNGNRILKKACEKGNFEIVKYLIEQGAIIDSQCLEYAGYSGNLDIVKYLVEKGQNPNNYDAFRYSCYSGHVHVLKYFVEHGIDINHDYSAFKICIRNKHIEAVKYLINVGISNIFKNRGVGTAAKRGYLTIVKMLVENGADVHYLNDKAITLASLRHYNDIVSYLNEQ